MPRDQRKRIEKLEAKAQKPRPMTDEDVIEAARVIRAGGEVPVEWAGMFTPEHLCAFADHVEFSRDHPMPHRRLPCTTDPGFDYRDLNGHMRYTEAENAEWREWSAAHDEFQRRQMKPTAMRV